MKKTNKHYRQGDVLIMHVKTIPQKRQTKTVTLALGEATGHHHSILENAIGFADSENALAEYFEVSAKTQLTHQEHDPIPLEKGKYMRFIQVEYTPQEIVNVRD